MTKRADLCPNSLTGRHRWQRVTSGARRGWWRCADCGRMTSKALPS